MKTYKIYRTLRVSGIEDVNLQTIGISWSASELSALNFSEQYGEDFILISSEVNADQINIAQTNAQWEHEAMKHEQEVVLNEFTDIIIEFEGKKFEANTGEENKRDESRPNPIECDVCYVTDFLDLA